MTFYKSIRNAVVDQDGKQIAIVLASNCTKKLACEMAAYAAQQANHAERKKGQIKAVSAKDTK
jgi:hypothetical protein